jgi:hypothetical protein
MITVRGLVMQMTPITWLLKRVGLARPGPAADGKPLTIRGWTIPRTPVEVLAQSLLTDADWLTDNDRLAVPGRLHRRGIAIGWKRAITGRFPGITLQIDGKNRPLSVHESYLLAKGVRHRLGLTPKGADSQTRPADAPGEAVT